jgi:hypothetical protein
LTQKYKSMIQFRQKVQKGRNNMPYLQQIFPTLAKRYKLPKGWFIFEGKAYRVIKRGE